MKFTPQSLAVLAGLVLFCSGCGKPAAQGMPSNSREAAKEIPIEDVADRLVSEAVLLGACVKGNNLTTLAGLAGRLDLSLEERLGRAWQCNQSLDLIGHGNGGAYSGFTETITGLMAQISRDMVTTEEAQIPELVKKLASKIRFATTEASKREELGNPQLYREAILEAEQAFNRRMDRVGAQQVVQRQQLLIPSVFNPIRAELPKLREKLIGALKADPEALAMLRAAMAVERNVPPDLKKSRERADSIIAQARKKNEAISAPSK
jgi:hypothetical protein